MEKTEAKKYAFSRFLYIIEASLEYFISIAVGTVYLAKITSSIGMSDGLTGVLTAFVSLGCGFQIIALFISHKKPVKKWVTICHIISQSLFALLYFVPLLEVSSTVKTVLLVVALFLAQIIHNAISAPKINWYMSLVDDKKRGSFTANKEIVSLISGILFTYALGYVMDAYATREAFLICGVMIFVIMGIHTLTLIFAKEKDAPKEEKPNVKKSIKELFKNKSLLKIIVLFVLWNIASYVTMSFSGAYQQNYLGFSTTLSSVIIIIACISRAIFSKPFGRFADKHSFSKMLLIGYSISGVAFLLNMFTVPENGAVMYSVFYILYSTGQAGINSAVINLAYDYVPENQRVGALALINACSGFAGFLTTLLVSPLVDHIQKSGNQIFGISAYSQQVMSAISLLMVIVLIIYLATVIEKIPKKKRKKLYTPRKREVVGNKIEVKK